MQNVAIVAPKVSRNIGVAATQIGGYSPAAGVSAIVSSLTVCNTNTSVVNVKVSLFDGTNDTYVAFNAPVAVGDTLMIGGADAKFTLLNGWSIRVLSTIATSVDAAMCVTEFS